MARAGVAVCQAVVCVLQLAHAENTVARKRKQQWLIILGSLFFAALSVCYVVKAPWQLLAVGGESIAAYVVIHGLYLLHVLRDAERVQRNESMGTFLRDEGLPLTGTITLAIVGSTMAVTTNNRRFTAIRLFGQSIIVAYLSLSGGLLLLRMRKNMMKLHEGLYSQYTRRNLQSHEKGGEQSELKARLSPRQRPTKSGVSIMLTESTHSVGRSSSRHKKSKNSSPILTERPSPRHVSQPVLAGVSEGPSEVDRKEAATCCAFVYSSRNRTDSESREVKKAQDLQNRLLRLAVTSFVGGVLATVVFLQVGISIVRTEGLTYEKSYSLEVRSKPRGQGLHSMVTFILFLYHYAAWWRIPTSCSQMDIGLLCACVNWRS